MERSAVQGSRSRKTRCSRRYMVYTLIKTIDADTTAVKRLNRYFCFLLLVFHLPVREKWAKMYKSCSQHSYLSIFLKILSFFR